MRKVHFSSLIPIALFALLTTLIILPACNFQGDAPATADQSDLANQGRFHIPGNWNGELVIYVTDKTNLRLEGLLEQLPAPVDPAQARPAIGLAHSPKAMLLDDGLKVHAEFEALYGPVSRTHLLPAPGRDLLTIQLDEALDPEAGFDPSTFREDTVVVIDTVEVICSDHRCSKVDSQSVTVTTGSLSFTGNCTQVDKEVLLGIVTAECIQSSINAYNVRCPEGCDCILNTSNSTTFTRTCLKDGDSKSWTFGSCTLTITGPMVFTVTVHYRRGPCVPQ